MSVDFKEFTRKMEKTLEVLQDDFGAANSGKFLVVGSNGKATAISLAVWEGGSY